MTFNSIDLYILFILFFFETGLKIILIGLVLLAARQYAGLLPAKPPSPVAGKDIVEKAPDILAGLADCLKEVKVLV